MILVMLLSIGTMLYPMDPDLNRQLIGATERNNILEVQALINAGADVNAQDKYLSRATTLIVAAKYNYKHMAELLLTLGAHTSAQDQCGDTPLIWATHNRYRDMAELLLKYGADTNIQNNSGQTALLYNVFFFGDVTIGELLLKYGANVNTQDKYGKTALMHATENGNRNMLTLLLTADADCNVKDNQGRTVLDIAKAIAAERAGYRHIVTILSSASGRQKLYELRERVARKYAEQYPGIPAQEIIKYLK